MDFFSSSRLRTDGLVRDGRPAISKMHDRLNAPRVLHIVKGFVPVEPREQVIWEKRPQSPQTLPRRVARL